MKYARDVTILNDMMLIRLYFHDDPGFRESSPLDFASADIQDRDICDSLTHFDTINFDPM